MLRPQSFKSHIQTDNILLILEHIRQNPEITKARISRDLNLTVQGVTNLVNRLQKASFIIPVECHYSGRGKPALGYKVNPGSAFAIGFHLDHEQLVAVLSDLSGQVIDQQTAPCAFATPQILAPLIEHLTYSLVNLYQLHPERFMGISIAMSAPLMFLV